MNYREELRKAVDEIVEIYKETIRLKMIVKKYIILQNQLKDSQEKVRQLSDYIKSIEGSK